MTELRESHELFNKIADIIDFEPHKYHQGVWGESATQFIGEEYVIWDPVNQDYDDIYREPSELDEATRVDDACGTAACVAGWACLLSKYHPTIQTIKISDTDEVGYDRYFPSLFKKFGNKIASLFSDRISYNYNVMCEVQNVETPINPDNGHILAMEDCYRDGTRIDGHTFYRPDYLAQELLCLDDIDAGTLFDADHEWDGDDLRRIGKGLEVYEVLNDNYDSDGYLIDNSKDE